MVINKRTFFAFWGLLSFSLGLMLYFTSVLFGSIRRLLSPLFLLEKDGILAILWYSGLPIVLGILLILFDLYFVVSKKRVSRNLSVNPVKKNNITVVLTAFNDEKSIGLSVRDFRKSKIVKRVIVISNNSTDKTIEVAKKNGAIVFNETKQGYGSCVHRALRESLKHQDSEIICLCEGDMTFRARDLNKFMAYIDEADVVNGTRIVEQLQDSNTQITTFMHYGNLAVAKLLEFKYLGSVTLTDVGTTYKVIRKKSLKKILPLLNPKINLEFNPYFLEKSIQNNLKIIECPISFYPRIGKSKGGNQSNCIAFKLGLSMIYKIIFGWK